MTRTKIICTRCSPTDTICKTHVGCVVGRTITTTDSYGVTIGGVGGATRVRSELQAYVRTSSDVSDGGSTAEIPRHCKCFIDYTNQTVNRLRSDRLSTRTHLAFPRACLPRARAHHTQHSPWARTDDPGGCLVDFVLDLRGEATPGSGDPGFSLVDDRRTRYPTMGGTAASPKHPRMAHDRT